MPMTTPLTDQFDSPWKDVLEIYFEDFMRFFFPAIHADIDWSQGYDFLDQELRQVVRDAELGKRLTDKLVKVVQRSGRETWVLIHIEIQSQEDGEFSERMFVYYYRLRDKYDREIASLAILGTNPAGQNWKPVAIPSRSPSWPTSRPKLPGKIPNPARSGSFGSHGGFTSKVMSDRIY
jgi:hypothetical protein